MNVKVVFDILVKLLNEDVFVFPSTRKCIFLKHGRKYVYYLLKNDKFVIS